MPIYAFACTACGHHFDRLQKMSDPDPASCPECSADTVTRQMTAPSFRLSGSGWYETDFKKDGDKKRNLTEKGEGASGGSAASEAKAAPKAEGASSGSAAASEAKVSPKADSAKAEAKPAAKPAAPAKPASGAS